MTANRTQPSLNRDFTLLSLVIVAILAAVLVWVTVESIHSYEAEVQKQMESEALRLDRGLIVEIENASYLLESLGRQIQATGQKQENIAQLFFSFAKSEDYRHSIFSWVDKGQMLKVSNNLGVLENPIDVSDRDYVKKSIAEPWKVHIGRPIDGRLSKKWVLPLSLGLTDKNGTYMGSVVMALDGDLLGDDIGRTLKNSGIHFAITNLSLTLLTHSPSAEAFFSSHFDVTSLSKINFDTTSAGLYSKGSLFDHTQIYSYFERSSQYPYILFLGLDAQQSREAIYKSLVPRLCQLVVIALFLLFVLWTVRKRIIQPVIALSEQTSRVLQGAAFDNTQTHGPLEIEQLSGEIKRLYDYIQERRRVETELRSKNLELTRIREAAQMTNQVKADFFSYVGHELTDPVEMILAQIETVKDQHFGPVGNGKYLTSAHEIHAQAEQLLGMLSDIKAISRAETGLLALNESEVDLSFVLQKSVRIFRDRQERSIDIQTDTLQELPSVRGDELRIKQMILNVLQAASHQLATGDTIRISTSLKSQELTLNFSYSTSGNIGSAARSKHGLDIALARLLIAMHQGALEMKTNADRVTTVTIRFPETRVVS